jgi:hypothetical protein
VSYGWRALEELVVQAIAAGNPEHLDKHAGGGMTCPRPRGSIIPVRYWLNMRPGRGAERTFEYPNEGL